MHHESPHNDPSRGQRPPGWLRRATAMILEDFGRPLTVQSIAHNVGVHPVHLSRVFRHYYHASIGDTLRRARVEFACDRLCEPDVQLADLALSAGFCDQSQLTHAFKKVVGTTPGRYRTQAQRAN